VGLKSDWLKANGFFAEGNLAKESKDYEKAIAKYRQAIAIYGSDFHYHYTLALALKLSGQMEAAAQSFRKATALNARDWKSWKGLGNCLYKTGDYKAAGQAFGQALHCGAPASEASELRKGVAACAARAH
jgi:tetratricopeptide (TPR) repeat protein